MASTVHSSNDTFDVIEHPFSEQYCGKSSLQRDLYDENILSGKLTRLEYDERMTRFEDIIRTKRGKPWVFLLSVVLMLAAIITLTLVFTASCRDDPNGSVTSTRDGRFVKQTCDFSFVVFIVSVFGIGIAWFIFIPVYYYLSRNALRKELKAVIKELNTGSDSYRGIYWRWTNISGINANHVGLTASTSSLPVWKIILEVKKSQ